MRAWPQPMQRLDATQSGLQLERVDLALFANEAKERLLGLLGPEPSAPSVATLLAAFAGFARRQAGAVRAMEAQQSLAAEVRCTALIVWVLGAARGTCQQIPSARPCGSELSRLLRSLFLLPGRRRRC